MCEKQQDYFFDFSKTNFQAMCEKQGLPPPPPMPSPVGTVSSLSMTNLARTYIIVCCHANHIFQLLPCCSIIPESHPTIPLLVRALPTRRPTEMVLLLRDLAFGKLFLSFLFLLLSST